jgi:hypothetical protein
MKLGRKKWVGHIARTGKRIGAHSVLMWKPEGKRTFGSPRCRWEHNIKISIQEVGMEH